MGISCECGGYDFDWYWIVQGFEPKPLSTKRSRKCCSCREKITVGDECLEVHRWRDPIDEPPYVEESIYGDEVPLASWWLCEDCGGLYEAIQGMGACCTLGDESLREQIREFNEIMGVQTIERKAPEIPLRPAGKIRVELRYCGRSEPSPIDDLEQG